MMYNFKMGYAVFRMGHAISAGVVLPKPRLGVARPLKPQNRRRPAAQAVRQRSNQGKSFGPVRVILIEASASLRPVRPQGQA
jgi:hypothetical protein